VKAWTLGQDLLRWGGSIQKQEKKFVMRNHVDGTVVQGVDQIL